MRPNDGPVGAARRLARSVSRGLVPTDRGWRATMLGIGIALVATAHPL